MQHTLIGGGCAEVSPEARYICCAPKFEPPMELPMRPMPNPKGNQRHQPTKGTRMHVAVHAAQVWNTLETLKHLKEKDQASGGEKWSMWRRWDIWVHVAKAVGYSLAVGSEALERLDQTKFAEKKFGHWSNEDSKDLKCASQGHVWSRCVMHVRQRPWLQVSLH